MAGDTARAEQMADSLNSRFPKSTSMQYMLRLSIALQKNNPAKAVEAAEVSAPYELGTVFGLNYISLNPVYFRGRAYLAAQQGSSAATEFQKILDHPGMVRNEPIGSVAHLSLGRAYALSGDSARAKTAYQDFFVLWKDADPDVPSLKQAKMEYAKLK